MTRLNVYAGPAGFFIIRGGPRGGQGRRRQQDGHQRGPAGAGTEGGRQVPPNKPYREISDRDPSIVRRERLALLPGHAGVLRRIEGPYIPFTDVSPITEPRVLREHDHGERPDVAVPHGRAATVPLPVPQRMPIAPRSSTSPTSPASRRGRSGTRVGSSRPPVNLTADRGEPPPMGLAERADVIVDFTNVPAGQHVAERRPRRAVRGGVPASTSAIRSGDDRAGDAVRRGAGDDDRRNHASEVPPAPPSRP